MNSQPLCDIIILTYNKQELTQKCLESLRLNTTVPHRLIIIDNCSTDSTRSYLASLADTAVSKVKLVFNKENKGFVGGMNQGIELSSAPYVCLSNNDLLFGRGWLEEMISVFEKYPQVGLLNPNSNSLGSNIPKGVSLADFSANLKVKYQSSFSELPFCIGFCLMLKWEVINKIGGLSEEFYPMFFEDSDYSLKAKQAGYLIGVAKGAYVWHEEHGSLKQLGEAKEKNFHRSRKTFLKKWGKILRLAWVVNSQEELLASLPDAVNSSRAGNYIWFFTRRFKPRREEIFQRAGLFEHSGINFIYFNNSFDLIWQIVKKKKKYDVIIDRSNFRRRLLKNYNSFARFDLLGVEAVKRSY